MTVAQIIEWTFMDPLETRSGTKCPEEQASPAWLAAPATNAEDTTE